MTGLLLDTTVWLAVQGGSDDHLAPDFVAQLEAAQRAGNLCISAASLLELADLAHSGRVELGMSVEQFLQYATADAGLHVLPLTDRILIESAQVPLPGLTERLLVASAREHRLTLITRNKALLDHARSGLLNVRRP